MSLRFLGAGASKDLSVFSVENVSVERVFAMPIEKCYSMQHLSSDIILASGIKKIDQGETDVLNPIYQFRLDGEELEVMRKYEEHKDTIWTIKMLDECRFATGCNDCYFKVWKVGKTESIFSSKEHKFSIRSIQNLRRTKPHIVWTGSVDRSIKIWDLNREALIESKTEEHTHFVKSLILDETKNVMISGAEQMISWDIRTNKVTSKLDLLENVITMVYLRDENVIIVGGDLGSMCWYDVRKLTTVKDKKKKKFKLSFLKRRGNHQKPGDRVLIPMVSPAKRVESMITLEDFFSDSTSSVKNLKCFVASRGNEIFKFDRKKLSLVERYQYRQDENQEFKTLSVFKNDKKLMEYVNHMNDLCERTLYMAEHFSDFKIRLKYLFNDDAYGDEDEGEDDDHFVSLLASKIFLL